jgi:hypothetical protein
MLTQDYKSVPRDEDQKDVKSANRPPDVFIITPTTMCISICLIALTLLAFTAGMKVGQTWESHHHAHERDRGDGLIDPQVFIGDSRHPLNLDGLSKRFSAKSFSSK